MPGRSYGGRRHPRFHIVTGRRYFTSRVTCGRAQRADTVIGMCLRNSHGSAVLLSFNPGTSVNNGKERDGTILRMDRIRSPTLVAFSFTML